ncbi:putative protein phosphatase 2C-like protein 45 [Cardamine amara subsp. amara]|uniref:RNase H type-1 domain-containing protein n=1 Tax=Cardamine amara subsp. amara TaxID=228776 RepID=A0ABD1AG23_CARAN
MPCLMPRGLGMCWSRPLMNTVKCNMFSSWRSSSDMCGGRWIVNAEDVKFHARDAFTPLSCKLTAEFRCIIWVLRCLRDLHVGACEIWSESVAAVSAIHDSSKWPRFQVYLNQIHHLLTEVHGFCFVVSQPQVNSVARDIAQSITRDGRFRSYLSIGGPAWLQSWIREERQGSFGD